MGDVRTEDQVQQDMDDVDYRDELMNDILTHIGQTGHTLTVVTIAQGLPHQQTFLTCTSCRGTEYFKEVDISRSRYARAIQREIKS